MTHCVGCLRVVVDGDYQHACPIIGQVYKRKAKGRKKKSAAAVLGGAAAQLRALQGAPPPFAAGPVTYVAINGPSCPAAAAAVEAGAFASFTPAQLLLAQGKVELAPHLLDLVTVM